MTNKERLQKNNLNLTECLSLATNLPEAEGGGSAEFNIAYGDTAPTDTSKLWVKTAEPSAVNVTTNPYSWSLDVGDKLPHRMFADSTAAVGKKIYLFGGEDDSYELTNTISVYDTETNTFSTLDVTLPNGVYYTAAAAVGTKVYLFGGSDLEWRCTNAIDVFDTETNTITTLSTTLPKPAQAIAAVAVGTKVYLLGGMGEVGPFFDSINVFDTETNAISTIGRLGNAFAGMAAVSVGKKIYAFGGRFIGGDGAQYGNEIVHIYDTENGTMQFSIFPEPCTFVRTSVVGTKIYLFGGVYQYHYLDIIFVYDTETNTTDTLDMKIPQSSAECMGSATIGTKIYVFGGYYDTYFYDVNVLNTLPPIAENSVLIYANNVNNMVNLLPNVEIGVNTVYLGNADGEGEEVAAALYKDGEWVEI